MIFSKCKTIDLFDKISLTIPAKLKYHQDECAKIRALFITDCFESFIISFEEGMRDMIEKTKEDTANILEYFENGKSIRFRRSAPNITTENGGYAFFSIKMEAGGDKLQLNGQMTAKPYYKWSSDIEPVLITILNGIRIKA